MSRCHARPCHLYAKVCAGIVCCHPNGLAYYQPAAASLYTSFPCFYTYAVVAVFYPDMLLAGALLDDEEMWSSLDSIGLFLISGGVYDNDSGSSTLS